MKCTVRGRVNPPIPSQAYLTVRLADVQIALPVSSVKEILRSVELAPVPGAPPILEGALNLRGTLLPVIDLRRLLGLPGRPNDPGDSLVILNAASRTVAVRVESADEIEEVATASLASPASVSPVLANMTALAGVAAREDGALVIFDPAAFLSQAEHDAIAAAIVATP